MLKACDQSLRLIDVVSEFLREERQPGKVSHAIRNLVLWRVFGIVRGYEDCNYSAGLANDPVLRVLTDYDPIAGQLLASQGTVSRFENQVDGQSLVKMAHAIVDTVISRHRKRLKARARCITVGLDPTDGGCAFGFGADRA